jgi:hypothetical protein
MRLPIPVWCAMFFLLGFLGAPPVCAWQKTEEKPNATDKSTARVAELLDLLEEQNKGAERFKDTWVLTLKEIVDVGPTAVPQLIAELDATQDDMMLRSLGFTLRAIGDKRSIPALIRAIPKTLRKPGSDMGFDLQDQALADFIGNNDLNEKEIRNFTFGRPVREILGALQKMTGQDFEDEQIYSIFLNGTVRQRRLRQELYHRQAQKWAN